MDMFLLIAILLGLLLIYVLPPLWLRWLAARCFLPGKMRWESAGWGTICACFLAPTAWSIVMAANLFGGQALFGERDYNAFWARLASLTHFHLWPDWAHVALYGLPYLLICLAFDWQWAERNLPRDSEGEKSRAVLWALTANALSFAWFVWLWCALSGVMMD